jgi:polyketide biosynthesis enoyl-CoA hydratase PksH
MVRNNSINDELIKELNLILDKVEQTPEIKMMVLKGQNQIFCTGMDFKEVANAQGDMQGAFSDVYIKTLNRISLLSKVVVCAIDGKVNAGGVGFVAASDYVIVTKNTQFTLSEAMFGLLPAMVLPYLIRRIGYQKAYTMTLTSGAVSGAEAKEIYLADELVENGELLDESIRRLLLKVERVNENTLKTMKQYFRKLWIIDQKMEDVAMNQLKELVTKPEVVKNITNFVTSGKFPWQS